MDHQYITRLEEENKALHEKNQELEKKNKLLEDFKDITLSHKGTWVVTDEGKSDDGIVTMDYKFEMLKMDNYEDKQT